MKKLKTKILNVLLVSAIGTAALGSALLGRNAVKASALDAPSAIFVASKDNANVTPDGEEGAKQTAFVLSDGGKISYQRNLAIKWVEEGSAKYLSLGFKFKDVSFETITFTFQTATATASDDNKENKVIFTSDGTAVKVQVNEGEIKDVNKDEVLTLKLSQEANAKYGDYTVSLNSAEIGTFTDIGGNYAKANNSTDKSLVPLSIQAELPEGAAEDASTTILFYELNGQKFDLDNDGKIKEDAKPVLVVNEALTDLTLGAKFDVDYTMIDVLDKTLQGTVEYYQYNPTHTEVDWNELKDDMSFSDTVYKKGDVSTTVFDEETYTVAGVEYHLEFVAIRIKVEDDSHKKEDAPVYDLSWFAAETDLCHPSSKTLPTGETANLWDGIDFLRLTKNKQGPTLNPAYNAEKYQEAVDKKVAEKNASNKIVGDSEKLYLPSVEDMFMDDNTRYTGFKYTVYYKSESVPNGSSATGEFDTLSIPVAKEGEYEFKIVAADKSGNPMTVLDNDDKEEVEVTSANVWELDNIPSYRFKMNSAKLAVEEPKHDIRSTFGVVDVQFSVDEFDVKGPSGYSEEYALFYFDMDAFMTKYKDQDAQIDESVLSSITFNQLKLNASSVKPEDVEDIALLYAQLYAEQVIKTGKTGLNVEDALTLAKEWIDDGIFRQIGEENALLSESVYSDNKYEWNATDKTFNPAEEGIYVVFGIFTHPEVASETVGGYCVVNVTSKEDIIAGETQWLKNNLASIILFAIAAVLLVIIIILLLIKPSDETLDDVVKSKKQKEEKKE